MKYCICLALLCCSGTSANASSFKSSHPAWMLGKWLWLNPGERYSPAECTAGYNITYHRDGSYDLLDESGYWRVEGNRLIETMTSPGGTGDPADRGKPSILLVERKDRVTLIIHGRNPGTMIRCPAQ